MNNGYKEVTNRNHPNVRANGTVLEHRIVASEMLGRPLTDKEVVHHIDRNRLNNDPSNLMVFRTVADHTRFHKTGQLEHHSDGTYTSPEVVKIGICKYCRNEFIKHSNHQIFCSYKCANASFVKTNTGTIPSKEELASLIYKMPFVQIGKLYGVTDSAVRKWCKKYGLPYKYWDLHEPKEKKTN